MMNDGWVEEASVGPMNGFSRPEGQLGQGDTIARPLKQVGPEESCIRKVTKMRKVLMNH